MSKLHECMTIINIHHKDVNNCIYAFQHCLKLLQLLSTSPLLIV